MRLRKPIVVSGYFVANAVKPLLALTTTWWQVLMIRFVDRFSKGIRGTARDVMVAESIPKSNIGSAYGLIQAMDSAGAIAGPLTALILLSRFGLRGIFWIAGVPGFFCVLVALLGIKETQREAAHSGPSPESRLDSVPSTSNSNGILASLSPRLPRSFYLVLVAVTLFSLGNSSDMFLVLRAQSIGIPVAHTPLLGLVFNVTYTLLAWPAGRLSDRLSKRMIAATGYLAFAAVYFVFALAPSRLAIWLAMASYGLFYALTNPVLKALVVEKVAPEVRGRALGLYFFLTSVAMLLASIIAGELWKHFGPRLPFLLSAGIALFSAGLLLVSRMVRSEAAVAR